MNLRIFPVFSLLLLLRFISIVAASCSLMFTNLDINLCPTVLAKFQMNELVMFRGVNKLAFLAAVHRMIGLALAAVSRPQLEALFQNNIDSPAI
jgi:hypothetical protein